MQLVIDFTSSRGDGKIHIFSQRQLVNMLLAALAAFFALVYFVAQLLTGYWILSGADITAEIAEKEIRAENEDRRRLWRESVNMLEDDIAGINARLIALYQKGATLSDRVGLPGAAMFEIKEPDADGALLCRSDEATPSPHAGAGADAAEPEEQQIRISDTLHRQRRHLDTLEIKYSALRDQSIHNAVLKGTVPMERPVAGRHWVSSRYGYRRDPFTGRRAFHAGDDYAARRGTPIVAGAGGIVIYAGRLGNYGNAVHLYHGDNISTLYGHMHTISVKAWEYVDQGEIIGTVGSTGRSTGPHLHYEVRVNNRPRSVIKTIKELKQQRNLPT